MTEIGAWLVPSTLGAVAAPSAFIVLLHGGQSTRTKLEAALPGSKAVVVLREGSSPAYEALANEFPTVRRLLAEIAPEWSPGTPLVVMGFSAGAYTLRRLLQDAQSRADVTAAIFLDGLYGAAAGECNLTPYAGVVEYGKLAARSPSSKRLIMTYSQAHPSPGICSEVIADATGGRESGVWVVATPNADHGGQQGVVGPEVVRDLVAPWIGGAAAGDTSRPIGVLTYAAVALAAAAAGWWWSRRAA